MISILLIFFADCEHLIRHMLVVEPERRYNLKQISHHRWMNCQLANAEEPFLEPVSDEPTTLNTVVVTNMLQLPNLTFDEIAESIHNQSFNHIYAIYNLLVDKLQAKRREQQRLQHHTNLAFSKYVVDCRMSNWAVACNNIFLISYYFPCTQNEEGKHHNGCR